MQHLLTEDDLTEQFQISRRTLRDWTARGKLPAPLRIGRKPFWPSSTIEAFIDAKAAEAVADAERRKYTADGRPAHRMIAAR